LFWKRSFTTAASRGKVKGGIEGKKWGGGLGVGNGVGKILLAGKGRKRN